MGKLIAIDGVDASGKQTHAELLYEKLKNAGKKVRMVSFPAYDNLSSSLVKMYLSGEFGEKPGDVSAYAASSFFAADRFATFRTDWGKDYNDDTIIIYRHIRVNSDWRHSSIAFWRQEVARDDARIRTRCPKFQERNERAY